MKAEFRRVKEVFLAAVEQQDAAEREAYLQQVCGPDEGLRRQVDALLGKHAQAGSFLGPSDASLAETVDEQPARERPGAVIGPYKLLEQIGEGGFGVVFLAEQTQPVCRRVALKVLKPGMDSRQVVARFEAERQALALMDHPNIARVFDAGATEAGRPYFVMELVKGVPVTQFCDEQRLTTRQRLELFVQVCSAVQHAHQKGIIHRDLKPSNVLVSRHDTTPVVKVIDFGVAKALGQKLTDKTLFTAVAQMVGTPLYMSPEQAGMSDLDVDTRGDIYSLGVLLYELLTGTTPFDRERFKEATYDEIRRIIREEEPPRPSTRLSGSKDTLASVSANRHTEPAKLTKLVRGELDWIVMKALEKDRNRSFETANGFALDVQRYLHDEPVLACPPSAGYRLRKFARRHRRSVVAGSIIILLLVAGVVGTSIGLVRAEQRAGGERRAKDTAEKRLAQIEKGTEVLASVFRDLEPNAEETEGVTLRVLLGRRLGEAARQLEADAVGDPLVVARLQHVLGISLRQLGHAEQAEVVVVKSWQTREQLLGTEHLDTAATKNSLAEVYLDRGKYARAEALFKEVLEVRSAKLGPSHSDTLETKNNLAVAYKVRGKNAQAEALYKEVLQVRIAEQGFSHSHTLLSKSNLAGLYHSQGKYEQAEAMFKEVLLVRSTQLGPDHPNTLVIKGHLAGLYHSQGKYEQAEALYKEGLQVRSAKLGPDHPYTLESKNGLAVVYRDQGKYAPAETLFKEVLLVRSAKQGPNHPHTLSSKNNLAKLYQDQKKYTLAERLHKEVLEGRTAQLGPDHPDTLSGMSNLAALYRLQGKYAPAERLHKEVLEGRTAQLGPDHPDTLLCMNDLAVLYWSMKRLDKSIPLFEEALKRTEAKLGPGHPDTLRVQANLGVNYCRARRFADGIPLLEVVQRKGRQYPPLAWVGDALLTSYLQAGMTKEVVALMTEQVQAARKQFPGDRPELAVALATAGKALLDAKAYADAEPVLRENLSLRETKAPDFWGTYHARSLLGGVLLGQKKYADAEPFLVQGYRGLKEREAKIPKTSRVRLSEALERLVQLYDAWDRPNEAAKWRKELEAHREAADKAAKPNDK